MSNILFPKLMGIVNITKDSFSDGGKYYELEKATEHALELIEQGADIIDIGGESTRPGSLGINENEEIRRTIPLIENIRKHQKSIRISIDTFKYEVAKEAIASGANIINDISGLTNDIRLGELAAKNNTAYVIMHKKGTPKDMQINPHYDNVVNEVYDFLDKQIILAKSLGIKEIYADIGIGFGKNYNHNLELLRNIEVFEKLDAGLLLGISRKSFIGKMLDIEIPENRDIPTLLIHTLLLKNKIDIIRIHNIEYYSYLKKIINELEKKDG